MSDYDAETDEFLADISSDRAGVISMVALFDSAFSDELRKRFVVLSESKYDRIFGDRGPLGTLSSKIEIGYALGLYGPNTRAILHNLRKIRNHFAHDHDVKNFNHPEVRKLCLALPPYNNQDGSPEEGRSRFNHALVRVMIRIHLEGQKTADKPSPPAALP